MARIMIIDDDRDIIDSLTMILEASGHEVVARTDTAELVAAVKEAHPDLVVLDIIFPHDAQAGFKAARELARDQVVDPIPVLVLSAVNELSNLGFSFTERDISEDFLPVQGLMEKPVEPARLLAKLDELLGRRTV